MNGLFIELMASISRCLTDAVCSGDPIISISLCITLMLLRWEAAA